MDKDPLFGSHTTPSDQRFTVIRLQTTVNDFWLRRRTSYVRQRTGVVDDLHSGDVASLNEVGLGGKRNQWSFRGPTGTDGP